MSLVPQIISGAKDDESIPFADSEIAAITPQPVRRNTLGSRRTGNVGLNISITVDGDPPLTSKESFRLPREAIDSLNPISSDEDDGKISITVENVPLLPLRRNSISLPSGLNTQELAELHHASRGSKGNTVGSEADIISDNQTERPVMRETVKFQEPVPSTSSAHLSDDTDSDDSDKRPKSIDTFRSKRRLSINPLANPPPALRLNNRIMSDSDFEMHNLGNQASITSISSVASLLREKVQNLPRAIRKKKNETKDYQIKIFVTILFFIIIFLICYAHVMYHQKVLTKSYFDYFKFNANTRVLRLFDFQNMEVIKGNLGVTFDRDKTPFGCHSFDLVDDGSVCLEWDGLARLYMNFENLDVFRCYTIRWQGLGDGVHPTDCYDLSRDDGHWFGGGITKEFDWSLNTATFDFAPFISGDTTVHQFGNAIKRYFINSLGVGIQVSDKSPLHLAVNRTANTLCLRAHHDEFAFVNRINALPELSYKVCVAEDMKSLHMLMTQQSLWDGLKEADIKNLHSIIEEPVWKIPSRGIDSDTLNETSIYDYSEEVIAMGFMRLGHILVNEFWQENIGDFTLDRERFPTLKDTIDVLHRRGFKIAFTVQPFISTDSLNFKDAVRNKLLIYERHSERSIPALTRYKSSSSTGVLDITNNASIPWLMDKLKALQDEYQVDDFYWDLGTAYNMPYYYQCMRTLDNPDTYARIFTESFESLGVMGVSSATKVPRPPAFVSTPPANSSWEGLREVVTSVVNYGIIGYPFVLASAVGGDYLMEPTPKMISFYTLETPPLPPQELYIRWLQLATFLPSRQFNHLPSEYKSEHVMDIAKELTSIRQKTVIPLLKKYLTESMNEGLPLVRPLWMLDPQDPACLSVDDEFSVGDELIVAPILKEGQEVREVYLPQGVWKDGIDSSLRKGNRWMHNYRVPKEKIAYFVKMPDNTRF